jgi:threonine aldolase
MKSFASDNYAGVMPEMLAAIQQANVAHAKSYGHDALTAAVIARFGEVFGTALNVYFVFNGTGANVLSISAATQSYHSVLCADISHFYNDESSAPETFTGCRFFPIPTGADGKLKPEAIAERLIRQGDVHYAQTCILSLTQSTEYGTVYTADEIRAITELCHKHGVYVHMDGSRFFNAAAALNCELKDISSEVGIDILSLGGTKAGMLFGEAVVVFNKKLETHIAYKHKQIMQLASKTRFIAAQFGAMLQNELWRKRAQHSNAMAQLLAKEISVFSEIAISRPVQANAVFAIMPAPLYEALQAMYPFYIWKESTMEVRLMCAWDTTREDILGFGEAIAKFYKS